MNTNTRFALIAALATQAGIEPEAISQQVVGPTWGAQISRQALIGLLVVLLAITLIVSVLTLSSGRATVLQGAVHLVVFAAFLFLAVVP